MNKRTTKPQQPKTDEPMRVLIQSLLANLIEDYDRTGDMKEPIYPETLPDDLPLEREVLTCIYDCVARKIAPTKENVSWAAHTLYQVDLKEAEAKVDNILTKRTHDGSVYTLSAWVFEDFKRRVVEETRIKANQEMQHGEGTPMERLERATAIIAEVVEYQDDSYVKRTQSELGKHMIEVFRRQKEIRASGRIPAPTLKFKGFVGERKKDGTWIDGKEGLVPYLPWGATTLITGPTGGGKTTIGGVLAEHNAWELGFDVVYFHNETEQETFGVRQIARNLLIPSDYQMNVMDIDDVSNPLVASVHKFYEEKSSTAGTIHYIYCPGWSAQKINATASLISREVARRGSGLLTIMDYYNLIDNSMFYGEEPSRLGQVALTLREGTKKENVKAQRAGGLGVHSIVFAQESETRSGEKYAYGSRQIVQYSQLHISIERSMAEFETPLGGVKDAPGHRRVLSKMGEWSHVTKLNVVKANNNSKGNVVIWVENAMSKIHEPTGAVRDEKQTQQPSPLQSNPN